MMMAETKAGYKKTDIGVIPEDWDVVPVSALLREPPKYGINAPAVELRGQLPVYIRITDISDDGRFAPSEKVGVDSAFSHLYKLNNGDIVLARTGASVGKSYEYREKDGELIYAGFLIKITPHQSQLCSGYLAQYLQSDKYWAWVKINSMRSGQPGINGNEYGQLEIPLPKPEEQQQIAAVLSDVDGLIEALSQLIAKKRDMKTAAMQQLLTGKKRLPGFDGKWAEYQIKEFTHCIAGGTPSTLIDEYWNGQIRWMSSGELNNKFIYDVSGRITELGLKSSSANMVPEKCVLIGLAGQGKTRGTAAINFVSLSTNQSIAAIFPSYKHCSLYLYYSLDSRYHELRELSSGGGGRGGLNLSIINKISIPFPSLEEQKAISQILFDIDVEIDTLEQRLAKARSLKTGMMQELLTGKTRLIKADNHKEVAA